MKVTKQNSFVALGLVVGIFAVFSLGAYTASFTKQTLGLMPGNAAIQKNMANEASSEKLQTDSLEQSAGSQP